MHRSCKFPHLDSQHSLSTCILITTAMTRPPDRTAGVQFGQSANADARPSRALSPVKSHQSNRSEKTPQAHFVHHPELDLFHHRPRKFAALLSEMIAATAIRRTWPHLVWFGAFSAMIVCLNKYVNKDLTVPNTLLTPLGQCLSCSISFESDIAGVVLGLALSYRMSSAYERYAEGRALWGTIIVASRNWARLVWIHCTCPLFPLLRSSRVQAPITPLST